jgi:hypothetical protein
MFTERTQAALTPEAESQAPETGKRSTPEGTIRSIKHQGSSTAYTFAAGATYKDEDGQSHDIMVQAVWDRSGYVSNDSGVTVPVKDLVLCRSSFLVYKGINVTFLLQKDGTQSPVLKTVFRADLVQTQNCGGGVYKRARLGGPGAC